MDKKEFLVRCSDLHPGEIIFFLGSGFTADLDYPMWDPLLDKMVEYAGHYSRGVSQLMHERIEKGDRLAGAGPFFEKDIPESARIEFFTTLFDKTPDLQRRHRLVASAPVAGFITTNFDPTIEQSLTRVGKFADPFYGSDRFTNFATRISLYSSEERRKQSGLVIKAHGDFHQIREMVLGEKQFTSLGEREDFKQWYRTILTSYTLIFIGFSGDDPNFLRYYHSILSVVVPPCLSYFLHSAASHIPEGLSKANIVNVAYSPDDGHEELTDILDKLVNTALREKYVGPSAASLEVREAEAKSRTLGLVVSSLQGGHYESAYTAACESIVLAAIESAAPHTDRASVLNRIQQTFKLSKLDAERILDASNLAISKGALEKYQASLKDYRANSQIIREGIVDRARSLDSNFALRSQTLDLIIKKVLEESLFSYGYSLALSLLNIDTSEAGLLDQIVRDAINNLSVQAVGDVEKAALELAFSDLFSKPSEEEAKFLAVMAEAALALGLGFVFPRKDILEGIIPKEVYLDANVVMPLIAKDHLKSANYSELVRQLQQLNSRVCVLSCFVNEVRRHAQLALSEIREAGIKNVNEVKEYAEFEGHNYVNVFLAVYALGGREAETFEEYMLRSFGIRDFMAREEIERCIRREQIEIHDVSAIDTPEISRLASYIYSEKLSLRRPWLPPLLAQHEAVQIYWNHVKRDRVRPWFITEDYTLRKILKLKTSLEFSSRPAPEGVLTVGGALLLSTILSRGVRLERGWGQILWSPMFIDRADQVISDIIKKSKQTLDLKNLKTKMSDVREKVAEILVARERATADPEKSPQRLPQFKEKKREVYESVYRMLGRQ